MSLQEKFQITVPAKDNGGEPWTEFKDARNTHGVVNPGDIGKMNMLPPGYEAATVADDFRGYSLAGETDATKLVNSESLKKGFMKKPMLGTDDQYTGEHIDPFYEDVGGFVERANVLDRM